MALGFWLAAFVLFFFCIWLEWKCQSTIKPCHPPCDKKHYSPEEEANLNANILDMQRDIDNLKQERDLLLTIVEALSRSRSNAQD